MADGEVTIIVDGDDSGIKKKLEDTKEGFEELGEKQKEAQNEIKETKSKYEELTDAIDAQKKELKDLKGEYTESIINFGKGSKEALALKEKISGLNSELEKNKEKLGKAENEADKLTGALEKNKESFGAAEVAVGDFVSDGLQNLIGAIGNSISSLFALADETREFREDMAKLNTAFSSAGHSTESAKKAYSDFYAILGESDRSVEAVNHLAELTNNEKELSQWSTIAAGVTAKFGDSLPIEGLTEAANETAKTGQVTGVLADALNWAGLSEDKFNEQLRNTHTEAQKAALITSTLNAIYADEAKKYNELTAATQEARRATAEMEQTQADIGAALEPLTTAWMNLKNNALQALLPVVEAVSNGFAKLTQWMEENPAKAEILKAVLLGVAAALGVIAVALGISSLVTMLTTAFSTLSAVLAVAFSPVTLIIAAIAALVAAFLYLWNNCEGFRNFFIGIWEAIKPPIIGFVELLKSIFSGAWEAIKTVWQAAQPYFSAVWEGIKAVFSVVVEVYKAYFSAAWKAVTIVWDAAVEYFKLVWEGIKAVFSVVVTYYSGMFRAAWAAITAIWDNVVGYFQAIWDSIKGIFSAVSFVLRGNWSDAWMEIRNIVSTWRNYFIDVWESIKRVFSEVRYWFSSVFTEAWESIKNVFAQAYATFFGIGENIVNGLKNGILSLWENLKQWFTNLFDNLIGIAEKILGIASPSKEFARIGEMSTGGLSKGLKKNSKKAISDVKDLSGEMISAASSEFEKNALGINLADTLANIRATVTAESSRFAASPGYADNGITDLARAVGIQTAGINSLAGEYRKGSGNTRPVVLQLNGRELGRAVVDVGGAEETRIGTKVAVLGGAH